METITVHIRPINWTEGDVYGLYMRLSGDNPAVRIDWGDGSVRTYYGNEINEYHIYPKDESLSFVVVITAVSGNIDYIDPTCGDCDYELIDFSKAPSIKEIEARCTQKIILDNPNLEKMSLEINLGDDYDLSRCPNLRVLTFQCSRIYPSIDLSHCHKLEWLSCWGYYDPSKLCKIVVANDAPLRYIDITNHTLHPSCLAAIRRIIERNGGEIVGESDGEEDEEE